MALLELGADILLEVVQHMETGDVLLLLCTAHSSRVDASQMRVSMRYGDRMVYEHLGWREWWVLKE
jgi:hypothetical protein